MPSGRSTYIITTPTLQTNYCAVRSQFSTDRILCAATFICEMVGLEFDCFERDSCRRQGCWIPPTNCNSGRLHYHYCLDQQKGMFLFEYTYMYMSICIHMYMCVYIYMYIRIYMCTNTHIYKYICICIYIYTHIHIYIDMYVCIHICLYTYILYIYFT